jgi:hypothetical protein
LAGYPAAAQNPDKKEGNRRFALFFCLPPEKNGINPPAAASYTDRPRQ